ncbi:hypothetical protein NJ69_04660 [Pseudomonas parafulva]|nr:hypothetical protein NJ69_04660 [Pseudomonas parafulva]
MGQHFDSLVGMVSSLIQGTRCRRGGGARLVKGTGQGADEQLLLRAVQMQLACVWIDQLQLPIQQIKTLRQRRKRARR